MLSAIKPPNEPRVWTISKEYLTSSYDSLLSRIHLYDKKCVRSSRVSVVFRDGKDNDFQGEIAVKTPPTAHPALVGGDAPNVKRSPAEDLVVTSRRERPPALLHEPTSLENLPMEWSNSHSVGLLWIGAKWPRVNRKRGQPGGSPDPDIEAISEGVFHTPFPQRFLRRVRAKWRAFHISFCRFSTYRSVRAQRLLERIVRSSLSRW